MNGMNFFGLLSGYYFNFGFLLMGIIFSISSLLNQEWLPAIVLFTLTLMYAKWLLSIIRKGTAKKTTQTTQVESVYEKWQRRKKK